MVGSLWPLAQERLGRPLRLLGILVLVSFVGLCWQSLPVYSSNLRFYAAALERHPTSTKHLYNMARELHRLGRKKEASQWYRQVLALEPERVSALYNLGLLELEQLQVVLPFGMA